MKPLVFSFFVFILGFSLLFDKKEEVDLRIPKSREIVQVEPIDTAVYNDSIVFFANRPIGWDEVYQH
ncbi:hypothetical protein LJC35_02880 [Parabacteroides sp. OttesenSCG-928-N08]|nr:hypothetical protein [Parabacteroides sp. OttesenSCG-928-N08]